MPGRDITLFSTSLRLKICLSLACLVGAAGCQPLVQPANTGLQPSSFSQTAGVTEQAKPDPTPLKGLDGEAVSELLTAEIAGQRGQVSIALDIYTEQALRLKSAPLARRATYIAQYTNNPFKTLEAAEIWSSISPDSVEPRQISSSLLIQQGNLLEAFDFQSELLTMGQETHFSYLASQSAETDDSTRTELLNGISDLIPLHPDSSDLLIAQSQILYFAKKYDASLQAISKALTLSPLNVRAILLQTDLVILQNGTQAGITVLRQAVQAQPDKLRLKLALAQTLVKSGDIHQAQVLFSELAQRHPENPQLSLSLALILMENGLTEQARQELEKLLIHQKEQDSAYYYLGRIEEQDGNAEQAVIHYHNVQGGNDFLSAHVRAARLQLSLGQTDEARNHLADLRVSYEEHRTKLYLLEAELLQSLEQTDEAYQVLTEALQSQGPDFELLYRRSMLSLQQNNIEQMEQDLREILNSDPNNAMVLNTLGYTLTEYSDRYSEALTLIKRAAALKPGDPAIIDSLGWVYYKLGQLKEAILFLQQAYNQLQDPEVASHLIEVYWVSGHREEAASLLLEARQLFSDNALLQDVEQRFPELVAEAALQADKDPEADENPEAAGDRANTVPDTGKPEPSDSPAQ